MNSKQNQEGPAIFLCNFVIILMHALNILVAAPFIYNFITHKDLFLPFIVMIIYRLLTNHLLEEIIYFKKSIIKDKMES